MKPHSTRIETDQAFLEQLYQNYRRLMFAIAHNHLSNPEDCGDVVQDAVLKLCRRVSVLRGLSEPALITYIQLTVRNTALNYQRHLAIMGRYAAAEPNIENVKPQDYRLFIEQKIDLSNAWERLSEEDQELLYRKYIIDQTNADLAVIFQCSEAAIRMRLSRARKRAAAFMKEEIHYERT